MKRIHSSRALGKTQQTSGMAAAAAESREIMSLTAAVEYKG